MHRRSLLATVGIALSPVAVGCLGTPDGDDPGDPQLDGSGSEKPQYEECPREVIPYDQLTDRLQAEVDAALEEGEYAAERVFLRDAMDVDESYLSVDGEYYDPAVSIEDGRELLTVEHVRPRALPNARSVHVSTTVDEPIRVEIVAEDGTVLLDERREFDGVEEVGEPRRTGTHDLRVTVGDGPVLTKTVSITEPRFSIELVVHADDVAVSGAIADLVECRFEE